MTASVAFPVIRSLRSTAACAPTSVLVPSRRPVFGLRPIGTACKICAGARAESTRPAVEMGTDGFTAVFARRVGRASAVAGSVVAVGVAASARRNNVLGSVIGAVSVEVVGTDGRRPRQSVSTPVAARINSPDLLVQDDSTDRDLSVLSRERMRWQVPRWACVAHSSPYRTTDPGERARVLGVAKPPPQVDGQLGMFEGIGA